MDTIMMHRQVAFLVCGLMSDPAPIIHLVYEHWINKGQKYAGKAMIESMFYEAGLQYLKTYYIMSGSTTITMMKV